MLPQPPREAISTSNNKHYVLLLSALRPVHIIRDTSDRERMRLGGQGADGWKDDVGMLSRLPGDVTTHGEANGVFGQEFDSGLARRLREAVPDPAVHDDTHQARRTVNGPKNECGPNIVVEAIGGPIHFRPQ